MSYVSRGLWGLGDLLSDSKVAATSFLNANKTTVNLNPFGTPKIDRDVFTRDKFNSSVMPSIVNWVKEKAGGNPGSNFPNALTGAWQKTEVVIPIYGNQGGIFATWALDARVFDNLADTMVGEIEAIQRSSNENLKLQAGNLFRAIYSGMSAAPQADVDWGVNQVRSGGWSFQTLEKHWQDQAIQFRMILQAVPWFTNQDSIYEAWRSKAWDVNQAIAAIKAAHPQPSGGGGGTGGKKESATTNLDFLKSPWIWVAAAAAGGLYYWTQVKNKSMGQLPYVGKYLKGR